VRAGGWDSGALVPAAFSVGRESTMDFSGSIACSTLISRVGFVDPDRRGTPVQTLWMPPTGFVNNCDGGRSHSYCDYRQQ
jgi:hypothetical protein